MHAEPSRARVFVEGKLPLQWLHDESLTVGRTTFFRLLI